MSLKLFVLPFRDDEPEVSSLKELSLLPLLLWSSLVLGCVVSGMIVRRGSINKRKVMLNPHGIHNDLSIVNDASTGANISVSKNVEYQ
jgi:hypothetical protein